MKGCSTYCHFVTAVDMGLDDRDKKFEMIGNGHLRDDVLHR